MPHLFRNWGRTASAVALRLEQPGSEEELVALVKRCAASGTRLKVVGGGHSWSDAACTDGVLVNLDRLSRVHTIDREKAEITVDAGIRLKELNARLDEAGLAMPVLGSIAEQSVAGAISTGTHGSAPGLGNLASLVTALRLCTADGRLLDLDAHATPELFAAAKVGLGALGIITRVTLRVTEAFKLEEVCEPMRFDDAVEAIPRLAAGEKFVKLWWLPHTDSVQVFRYRPTNEPSTFSALQRWIDDRIVNRWVFALVLLLGRILPPLVPLLAKAVRVSYFRPRSTIGRSFELLNIAMPPVHQEVEYALPVAEAADALRSLRALIEREKLLVNFVAELRFVAADDAWMSPSFGRASCFVGAYMAPTRDLARYFAAFEGEMRARGGRPHWGKQFATSAEELRRVHPMYDRFVALRAELDPQGLFDNAFLRRTLTAKSSASADQAVSKAI